MAIGDVLRAVFYLILLGSLAIYLWRFYRHVVHHETRHDRAEKRRLLDQTNTSSGPASSVAPTTPGPRTPAAFAKGALARPSVPDETVPDGSLVREAIRQELAKKRAAATTPATEPGPDETEGGAGRTGLFAKPHRSVAELVVGIAMPADLAPLVGVEGLDPDRVLFVTTGHAPAAVASSMADELERLGFRIDAVAENEALARKPAGDLRLIVHDDVHAFPNAPGGSVVVELAT